MVRCRTNGSLGSFYLDGAFVSSFLSQKTGDFNNTGALLLGRRTVAFAGNSYYSGCMDELEIFKRALSLAG